MPRELNIVKEEYEKACEENNQRFQSAPMDMTFEEFKEYMRESNKKVAKLSREYRLIQEPDFWSTVKEDDHVCKTVILIWCTCQDAIYT